MPEKSGKYRSENRAKKQEPAVRASGREVRTEEIGVRLASVRGHLSQKDFAERVGVSQTSWARYERGERYPDAETLLALEALGVSSRWVLTGEEGRGKVEERPGQYLASGGEFSFVPRLNAEVCAGHGAEPPLVEARGEPHAFRKDWLSREGLQ